MHTLEVEKREAGHALSTMRKAGRVPGVVYGAKQASTSLSVDLKSFEKVLREAGENSVVTLEGLGASVPTLIHEVDLDPLTSRPRHIDFYAIVRGEKVEIAIPIEFVGESAAVRGGDNLVKVMHEIEVKADPMNLPHSFEVDIAKLEKVGDQIHVSDIKVPAGVELLVDAHEVVALIQEVQEEKAEEAPAADLGAIEVEKKGKEEEAEGEAAEAKK